ncbi:MAG: phage integrase family protein, partial [Duodenibacillus sp.]|nr:phage integrase family protein [Duodenibacillus sp.]
MSSSVLCVTPETALSEALPDCLAGRVLAPLAEMDIRSVEDLYDCIAGVGGNWYRQFAGITREDASALVDWLAENAREVGEVTEVFYPSGCRRAALPAATESVVTALETLHLSETLSGRSRSNRGASNEIDADDDLDAVRVWLDARAANPNTRAQYQKEMERFVLWCTVELGRAMSDVTAREAALYPKWLEMLGRTAPKVWEQNWRVAQDRWI